MLQENEHFLLEDNGSLDSTKGDVYIFMSNVTAKKVLDVARGWIGRNEKDGSHKEIVNVYNSHKPLARGYTLKYTDDWCDAFVSAVAIKAGAVDLIGTEVGCEKHIAIFKQKGIWIEDGTIKPQPGDIILFNWKIKKQPNDGFANHIGFVEQVHNNTIITIEGNMNDKVGRRELPVGDPCIRGFARPRYAVDPNKGKTSYDIALEVINGKWGNGEARKKALAEAGYDYNLIQSIVTNVINRKSVEEVAKEVLQGKWGNGAARKEALIKAGYDYTEVQKKVNELIGQW